MNATAGPLGPTPRTALHRRPQRGHHDRATVEAILDEGLVCHVGFLRDGAPVVIPTAYVRIGDQLYLHGAPANAMLRASRSGTPICVTVTLLDGLVLARSTFHQSMNYRSVVIFGQATLVEDPAEKARVLAALVEHVTPGRSADARPASEEELRGTQVVALPLHEASAKIREGGPIDDEADMALPHWAGVVPLRLVADAPIPDPVQPPAQPAPAYATGYRRPTAARE